METDFYISPEQRKTLIALCNSLKRSEELATSVFDYSAENGDPLPPDVRSALVGILCQIEEALDYSLLL